jgi:hypothetical protein
MPYARRDVGEVTGGRVGDAPAAVLARGARHYAPPPAGTWIAPNRAAEVKLRGAHAMTVDEQRGS